jgi:prolyl-tRNA synthetase
MKDSYSLDVSEEGLDRAFQLHFEAYRRIFERCGLDAIAVEASSGAMGGSESIEFMIPSDAGEDWIACCASCGYAANTEKATSPGPIRTARAGAGRFPPRRPDHQELARFEGGAPAERQIATLVYARRPLTLVPLRGDPPCERSRRDRRPEIRPPRRGGERRARPRPAASARSAWIAAGARRRGAARRRVCRPARTRTTSTCAASTSSATCVYPPGTTCAR